MPETIQPSTAQIVIGENAYEVPLVFDAYGNPAPDITGLYKKTGIMMVDRGFTSTASCESGITFIDGDKGLLFYRGYPIEQLAEKGCFVESAYLLLNGELPTRVELCAFEEDLRYDKEGNLRALIDEQMIEIVKRYRRNTHPMLLIGNTVAALDAFYGDIDFTNLKGRNEIALNLIAKIPTIVALAYRYTRGRPIIYPRGDLGYAENFLRMCFADTESSPYPISKTVAQALDKIFMLHADHEQNASTATVRLSGSTGVVPHAAVATGVAALWGPNHGGANEAVLKMLEEIGSVDNIPAYIEKTKDKRSGVRLMGFGHRVYQTTDPRAKIIYEICHEVLDELKINDPLLKTAKQLEHIALHDEYFIRNNLYPNVDFYSGIILKAINFPPNMFTALFALARTTGWIAQWKEMVESGPIKIGRPRQHYIGHLKRDYVPLELREPLRNVDAPTFGLGQHKL